MSSLQEALAVLLGAESEGVREVQEARAEAEEVIRSLKEQQRNKKRARVSELKQIRLGMKIGQHDLDIKLKKVQSFLEDGDKVRIQLMYRGRENAHQELGFDLMNKIIDALGEDVIVEQKPQINGRNLSMIVRSK